MKTKILIIIPIVVVIIASIVLIGNTSDIGIGQKHQYKFWVQEIKLEGDIQVTRVFFSHSNDYGKTFSEPSDMSMTENYAHEPKMITMYDDVILVWRDEVDDDTIPNLSFAKSPDFGKTFEKKRLFQGARPDIVHHDDILYLTWVDLENRRVLYSTSDDRGETFEEPIVIFAPTGEFSPYADKPIPKFAINEGIVKISWSMLGEDYEDIIGEDQFGLEHKSGFRQNDFDCFTYWKATLASQVDFQTLEVMLRDEIAHFGSVYDLQGREIMIESIGDNRVEIAIQGCWGWPESNEPDLEMAIENLEVVEDVDVV